MENQEPSFEGFSRISKSFDDYYNDPTHPYAMVKVFIDGEELKTSFTVEFTQRTNDHDTFKIITPDDSFDSFEGYILEKSRHLFGKNVMIQFARFGRVTQTFEGIITNINNPKHDGGGYGDLHIIGAGTSILLESGKDCRSFEDKSLDQIIKEVCENYPREARVEATFNQLNLDNRFPIHYTVQYKESDYEFIKRLAKLHGEFFYYTGDKLIFGNTAQDYIKIQENSDLAEETFYASLLSQDFKYLAYNPETGEVIEQESQKVKTEFKANHFGAMAVIASRKIFPKKPVMQFNNAKNERELEKAVRLEREKRENLFFVKGKSRAPELKIGGRAELSDINGKAMETYRIIEIRHYHDGYDYYNEFIGIPDLFNASPFIDTEAFPVGEIQSARVMDNNDPKGMGRVRVQFPWQIATNQMTPWIHVVTPHAGANKGIYFPPEIGEEVLINYENNNAEKPFVMGAMYNGAEKSGYHTAGNDLKAIHSRSNNRIVMNDREKSLLMEDGSQSFFKMKGNRTAEINTDVLEINVRKLIINASQSTEITTNDYILNALSRIYIFSNWMKQHINGFMHLFSNKALINSTNTIDIEAKEAKFHGTEKALVHSDKTALINSKGTAEMHGVQGNNQTNVAKKVSTATIEEIALATVYFRPLNTWNGEFGFDWLREKDNGLLHSKDSDPDYESIIEGGYRDGVSDLLKTEAFEQLKAQYPIIPIKKKPTAGSTTPPPDGEYFVPYLTLFSKEFVNKTTFARGSVKPKYEAELQIFLEIEDDLDKLEFDFDKSLFDIKNEKLSENKKTGGLVNKKITVKITCKKDLNTEKEIRVFAYPKGTKQPLTERKLAGKIIVLQNDNTARKEEKFALVPIRTNITGKPKPDDGGFSPKEKQNFYNTFHQALTIPILEISPNILDLSSNADFKTGGKYVDINNKINEDNSGFFEEVQRLFFEDKDAKGVLKNAKYTTGYFTVFSLGADVYDDAKGQIASVTTIVAGVQKTTFLKNLILFPKKDFYTMNHEGLHGFNLRHTHRDSNPIDEPNYKYIFPCATANPPFQSAGNPTQSTNNVMCYRDIAYSTWRWQWHIINPNISEK